MHLEPESKPSLCIFLHFSEKEDYPHYVQVYVNELCRFFDEVILVSNERQTIPDPVNLNFKVRTMFVKNEGYDFGMFYKAWQTLNPSAYSRIACINDSNILLQPLDGVFAWASSECPDFWGLLDSRERPHFTAHQDVYHVQSHFLVLETPAISKVAVFFKQLNINPIFEETDLKIIRRMVIDSWEIGLTQYLKQEGLRIRCFIDANQFSKKHKLKPNLNLTQKQPILLLEEGYPLMKKRLINPRKKLADYFKKPPVPWQQIVKIYCEPQFFPDQIIEDFS